jgi:hypothetical protein
MTSVISSQDLPTKIPALLTSAFAPPFLPVKTDDVPILSFQLGADGTAKCSRRAGDDHKSTFGHDALDKFVNMPVRRCMRVHCCARPAGSSRRTSRDLFRSGSRPGLTASLHS